MFLLKYDNYQRVATSSQKLAHTFHPAGVGGLNTTYLIEVDRPGTLDRVRVQVELRPELFSDRMDRMQALRERIAREIHTVAGIRAEVALVEPRTIERFAGKAKRVLDRRNLGQADG